MQQYKWYQAIYMSFYSKNLYRDVARNWNGKTFLYLIFLLALSWVYSTFQIQTTINTKSQLISNELVKQIPFIIIKDGKIITPQKIPYIVLDPRTRKKLVMIDTSGRYKTLESADTKVLITETEIISHHKADEIRIYKIPQKINMEIDPDVVSNQIKNLLSYAWIFLYILCLAGSYIYRIVQALIYSLIGLIFNAMNGTQLSYVQIVQIMMVATTPVIVIATIVDAFHLSFAFQYLWYVVLALGYLYYGIVANKNTAK